MENKVRDDKQWCSCTSYLFHSLRPLLQVVLLVTFLVFFGLPAITRYQAKRVVVVLSKRDTEGIVAPTISIAAWNPETKNGWKGNASMTFDLIGANCEDQRPVVDCIEKKTFSKAEVFKDVVLGLTAKKSVLTQEDQLIREDFTTAWDGIFHAVNVQERIGPDDSTDQLYVLMDKSHIYNIFIHDPNYFIVNENPAGLPSTMLKLNPNSSGNYYYRISLTEVEELDLPEDPCNVDPDYNFRACVKQSLSSQVGCRTKWDSWSQEGMELCSQMEQFRFSTGTFDYLTRRSLPESSLVSTTRWTILNWTKSPGCRDAGSPASTRSTA